MFYMSILGINLQADTIFSSKVTYYLRRDILYEHFQGKLCWADTDYEVLNFFQALKLLTI